MYGISGEGKGNCIKKHIPRSQKNPILIYPYHKQRPVLAWSVEPKLILSYRDVFEIGKHANM